MASHLSSHTEQNQNLIRVLIVDDQKVIRAKIQTILSTQSDLEIVGMAGDGEKAIDMISVLKPDVVLMDIELPNMNGIEATKIISQKFSQTKILVLSTHEKGEYVQKIIVAGAAGYILKQTPAPDFIAAIYAIHRGYSHFGPNILKKIQIVAENENFSSTSTKSSNQDLKQVQLEQKTPQDSCEIVGYSTREQAITEQPTKEQLVTQSSSENSNLPTVQAEEFLPPIEKWLTWGGLCVMITLIAILPLSSLLKYKTKVKSPATIRPQGEVRLVQAQSAGNIANILSQPGDVVAQGDVIAILDTSNLMTRQSQLEKAIANQKLQLIQLDSQIASIDNQIFAEQERNRSEIRAAQARLLAIVRTYDERKVAVTSQVEEANANLKAAEATLKVSENRLIRFSAAAAEGALSKEQLAETQLEVRRQQQEITAAQARLRTAQAALNPSDAEVDAAQQDIEQARKSGQASIASLNRQKEGIIQQQITVNQQLEQDEEELKQSKVDLEKTIIKATAPGEISQLDLRNPGQTVTVGQEIAQIVPNNAALEIRLLASPQDIGKLELNQRVQMRVSACPYPDYGVLEGQISRIARDIIQPSNNGNNQGSSVYEVFVKPEAKSFGRAENSCLLKLGMDGTAEIITKEESVLKFILRKARLISNI